MAELVCAGCGRSLEGESFCGPPRRWFATEGVLSVVAARAGWVEGYCPDCVSRGD